MRWRDMTPLHLTDTSFLQTMKKIYTLLTAAFLCLAAVPAYAVTDKEMEEARAITAITYLRYANDASGYLDEHHPKTMAELQKILKEKEKENLRTFTAVKTPGDYASWDKQKLIDYWAGTFYSSPGLLAKGKIGKSRTRSRLNAMKVSAPSQNTTGKAEEAKKAEETKKAEEAPKAEERVDAVAVTAENEGVPANGESAAAAAMAGLQDSAVSADSIANAPSAAEMEDTVERKSNPTWIYIAILIVLVGVVAWLVIYASNTMKNDNRRRREEAAERGENAVSDNVAERVGNAAMREKYTESLNQKNGELRRAAKEVSDLRAERESLLHTIERQKEELAKKDQEIERLRNGLAAIAGQPAPTRQPDSNPPATQSRAIYLGRVNMRGLFVRADKTLNPEHTVYRLETEDGYSGTFRVVNNPQIDRRLLSAPGEWLAGGCVSADLEDTANANSVFTESSGTAIFEGGAWKVIRKARISYK